MLRFILFLVLAIFVARALWRLRLGDELFRLVFPHAPLVAP